MKTKIATPLTDHCERLYHERSDSYTVRDLCLKLEQRLLNRTEARLIMDLIKLWHAAWEEGSCKRDCQCVKCRALEDSGNHDKATFNSLTKKVSDAMSNNDIQEKE